MYFVHLANSCRQYPSFFLVLNRSSHMKTINYTFAPRFVFKLIKYRKGIVESITLKASAIHSALSVFCKNTSFNHNLCVSFILTISPYIEEYCLSKTQFATFYICLPSDSSVEKEMRFGCHGLSLHQGTVTSS